MTPRARRAASQFWRRSSITQSSLTCGAMEMGLSGCRRRSARSYGGRNFPTASLEGILTMCWEWVRKAPSMATAQGMRTRLSSAMRYAIRMCSKASCGVATHTSSQPISRSAMASLCSTPKAPGSSSARLPTRNTGGNRSDAVTTKASKPYIQPVPLLPASARAFPAQGNDFAGDVFQSGASDEGMDVASAAFHLFCPLDVLLFVFGVGFPRAGVVLKLQFIHHHDAFVHGADLGALAAADAVFVSDVVESVGRLVEAFVRTF